MLMQLLSRYYSYVMFYDAEVSVILGDYSFNSVSQFCCDLLRLNEKLTSVISPKDAPFSFQEAGT